MVDIEMVVIEDDWYSQCPFDYPEEIIYETWMGTRAACDCLEREGDRLYDLDTVCRRGKGSPYNSEDCLDSEAIPPIVQNKVKGIKYCGKLAEYSLKDMVRPVLNTDKDTSENRKYVCPSGFRACNEEFFDEKDGHDYVVCIPVPDPLPEDYDITKECPITSLSFKKRDDHELMFQGGD